MDVHVCVCVYMREKEKKIMFKNENGQMPLAIVTDSSCSQGFEGYIK